MINIENIIVNNANYKCMVSLTDIMELHVHNYWFANSIPQNLEEGIHTDIESKVNHKNTHIINDLLTNELERLAEYTQYGLTLEQKQVLLRYTQTLGYSYINKKMRNGQFDDSEVLNLLQSFNMWSFNHILRLFRTESLNYQQCVNGKMITANQLVIGDTWVFNSFVSTTITNKPSRPKIQSDSDKTVIFVFVIHPHENLTGLLIPDDLGVKGECEFLLGPMIAQVIHVYRRKIAFGYIVSEVPFVVCTIKKSYEPFHP